MAEVLPGRVGELKLTLGNNIPPGFLSVSEGTLVSRTQYKELWDWASKNTSVLSETNWQKELTNNGSVSKFSSGDGSSTFRLPKIIGIIAGVGLSSNNTFTKAVYSDVHFHAMGSWSDNNGWWGYYKYSNATYPSGTTGIFWNGRGSAGNRSNDPPTSGIIITSNSMYSANGSSASGSTAPRPATVNFTLCIRYTSELQETATQVLSTQIMQAAEELTNAVNLAAESNAQDTLLEETGYSITQDGLVTEWGTTPAGVLSGRVVLPVSLAEGTKPFNISTTLVEPTTMSGSVAIKASDNLSFEYECQALAADSYVMWTVQGRV